MGSPGREKFKGSKKVCKNIFVPLIHLHVKNIIGTYIF